MFQNSTFESVDSSVKSIPEFSEKKKKFVGEWLNTMERKPSAVLNNHSGKENPVNKNLGGRKLRNTEENWDE